MAYFCNLTDIIVYLRKLTVKCWNKTCKIAIFFYSVQEIDWLFVAHNAQTRPYAATSTVCQAEKDFTSTIYVKISCKWGDICGVIKKF